MLNVTHKQLLQNHKPGLVYHKCEQGFVVVVVVNEGLVCMRGLALRVASVAALVVFPDVTIVCIVALFATSVSEPNQLVNFRIQKLEHVKMPKIFMTKEWQEAICRHCMSTVPRPLPTVQSRLNPPPSLSSSLD